MIDIYSSLNAFYFGDALQSLRGTILRICVALIALWGCVSLFILWLYLHVYCLRLVMLIT